MAAADFLWMRLLLHACQHAFLSLPLPFSGCDVNSPRQPGANGEGEEEARDGQTPLHLAASWGLEETIQCLLEFGANVNAQVGRVSLFWVEGWSSQNQRNLL